MFCKHRWVNVKKWTENKMLVVIQKCRWCNIWQRLEVPMATMIGKREHYSFGLEKQTPNAENPGQSA